MARWRRDGCKDRAFRDVKVLSGQRAMRACDADPSALVPIMPRFIVGMFSFFLSLRTVPLQKSREQFRFFPKLTKSTAKGFVGTTGKTNFSAV